MHELPQGCEFRHTLQQDDRGAVFTGEADSWEPGSLSAASRAASTSSTFGVGSDGCTRCCEPTAWLFFGRRFRFCCFLRLFSRLVGTGGGGGGSCAAGMGAADAASQDGLGVSWVEVGGGGVELRRQTILKQATGSTNSAMRLISPEKALFVARVDRRREFVITRAIGFHCFGPMLAPRRPRLPVIDSAHGVLRPEMPGWPAGRWTGRGRWPPPEMGRL